jgi:hypothetical protein
MLDNLSDNDFNLVLDMLEDVNAWYQTYRNQTRQMLRETEYLERLQHDNYGLSVAWREGQRKYHSDLLEDVTKKRQQTLQTILREIEDIYLLTHDTPSTAYSA